MAYTAKDIAKRRKELEGGSPSKFTESGSSSSASYSVNDNSSGSNFSASKIAERRKQLENGAQSRFVEPVSASRPAYSENKTAPRSIDGRMINDEQAPASPIRITGNQNDQDMLRRYFLSNPTASTIRSTTAEEIVKGREAAQAEADKRKASVYDRAIDFLKNGSNNDSKTYSFGDAISPAIRSTGNPNRQDLDQKFNLEGISNDRIQEFADIASRSKDNPINQASAFSAADIDPNAVKNRYVTDYDKKAKAERDLRSKQYSYMTDEEKLKYNALYGLYGRDTAEQYHDMLLDEINRRIGTEDYEKNHKNDNVLQKAGYEFGQGVSGGMKGLARTPEALLGITRSEALSPEEYAAEETIIDEKSNFNKNVYSLMQSWGNMAPGMAAGFLTGGAGDVVFALSQYGNSYREAMNNGENASTAGVYAAQQGVDELATNMLLGGIGTLGKGAGNRLLKGAAGEAFSGALDDAVKSPAVKKVIGLMFGRLADMGSEAAQEYMQYFTQNWTQYLLNMKDENGEPVELKAWNDPEAAKSAYMGAISAFFLNFIPSSINTFNAVRTDTSGVADLSSYVNNRMDTSDYTEADMNKAIDVVNIANEISARQEQGKSATPVQKIALSAATNDLAQSDSYQNAVKTAEEKLRALAQERLASAQEVRNASKSETVTDLVKSFGENGKEVFSKISEDLGNASETIDAFRAASQIYNSAMYGTEISDQTMMNAAQILKPGQIDEILKAGARDADMRYDRTSVDRIRKMAEAYKPTSVKTGNVDFGNVDLASFDSSRRAEIETVNAFVTKGLGINLKWYTSKANAEGSYQGANGSYDSNTNTIYLDTNAGANSVMDSVKLIPTVSHELTHWLEKYDSVKYKQMSDAVLNVLVNDSEYNPSGASLSQLIQAEIKRLDGRLGGSHSDIDATHELVARACEDMLTNSNKAKAIFDSIDAETKRTIWSHIKGVFENLKKFFNHMLSQYSSSSREAQAIRRNISEMEKIEKMWSEGLESNLELQETVKLAGENASAEIERASSTANTNFQDEFSLRQFAEACDLELVENVDGYPYAIYDPATGKKLTNITEKEISKTSIGTLIDAAVEAGTVNAETADAQKKMFARLMNLVIKYNDAAMVWDIAGSELFSAIKSNADKQYVTTIDFGTICSKTQALIDVMSNVMVEKGRGLTRDEIIKLYAETSKTGLSVPCPVCYVFSRWLGVPSLLETMRKAQIRYGEKATAEEVDSYIKSTEKKYGGKEGINSAKTSLQNKVRGLETKLQKALQNGDAIEPISRELKTLQSELEEVEMYNWVTQVRCKTQRDGKTPVYKNGKVELDPNYKNIKPEILLDMRRTGEFAAGYPKAWKYRTTRGAGMGKAMLPYSGASIGDFIHGTAKRYADKKQNPFLSHNLKSSKRAIENAIKRARKQNLIGGQRIQSTSDFRAEWGIDYLMTFLEMQAAGSKAQLYTKVIEAVDLFATSGAEVNLSIMGKGNGYSIVNGKPVLTVNDFSSVTGIDFEQALKKTRTYDNVQMILVGLNDTHIRLALSDDRISFVIPWHSSGSNEATLKKLMSGVNETLENGTDYSDTQSDKFAVSRTKEQIDMWNLRMDIIMGKASNLSENQRDLIDKNSYLSGLYDMFYNDRNSEAYHNFLNKSRASQIFPYEYWDTSITLDRADENGRRFQEYCASMGIIPRFSGYEKDGVVYGDFTNDPGYWKLLIDRRMYNRDGTYHAPKAIDVTNVKISSVPVQVNSNQYKDMSKIAQATQDGLRAIDYAVNETSVEETDAESVVEYSDRIQPYLTDDDVKDYIFSSKRNRGRRLAEWQNGEQKIIHSEQELRKYIYNAVDKVEQSNHVAYGKVSDKFADMVDKKLRNVTDLQGRKITVRGKYFGLVSSDIVHTDNRHRLPLFNDDFEMPVEKIVESAALIDDFNLQAVELRKDGGIRFVLDKQTSDEDVIIIEVLSNTTNCLNLKSGWVGSQASATQYFEKLKNNSSVNFVGEINITETTSDTPATIKKLPYSTENVNNNPSKTENSERGEIEITTELNKLIEQYGVIPKGENAVKDVSVPAKTSDDKNVRRFVRTVLESGITTDDMDDEIKKQILDEAMSYTPISDQRSVDYAEKTINTLGMDESLRRWEKLHNGTNAIDKDDIVLGEALLRRYAADGNTDMVVKLTQEIAAEGTRMGQNVQALRLLKKMSTGMPEVGLGYIQNTVDKMNKDLSKKLGRKVEIKINEELAAEYLGAKDPDAVDAALGKIYKDLAGQIPKTKFESFADSLRAWRYLSMLGNPRTHVRNLVGNALFVPVVEMKNAIGTALESATRGTKTKSIVTTKESRDFARRDFLNVKKELQGNANGGILDEILSQQKPFRSKTLNKINDINSGALEGEDLVFLKYHYVRALSQYITANKVSPDQLNATQLGRARSYAIQEAKKATYRDASAFATWLNQSGKLNAGVRFIVEGTLPFKKTPTNILKRGIEYSPAGLVKAITKGTYDLNKGNITVNEWIDELASGLTGTMIVGLGMFLASLGAVRGGYDDDDKDLEKLMGEQEYSARIGNHTYTIDWAAPAALPFFVGVELMAALRSEREGLTFADVSNAAASIVDPMQNLSMLSGLNDTLEAISYSDNKLSTLMMETFFGFLGQFVPTLSGQIARTVDNTQRINYQDKNTGLPKDLLYFMEKVQNKIPFMSFQNDPYLNQWGEENVQSRWLLALQNFISPGYISHIRDDAVTAEISRLQNSQETNIAPKKMPKYLGTGEDKVDLTSEQYTTFQRTAGQTAYYLIDDIISDKRYESLLPDEQAAIIKYAYDYAKFVGRRSVQPEYEPTTDKWLTVAKDQFEKEGKPVKDYIYTKAEAKKYGANAGVKEVEKLQNSGMSAEKFYDQQETIKSLDSEMKASEVPANQKYTYVINSNYSKDEKIAWFKSDKARTESEGYKAWKSSGGDDWSYIKSKSDLSKFSGDGKQKKIVKYIKAQATSTKKQKALWQMAGYKLSTFDKNMK